MTGEFLSGCMVVAKWRVEFAGWLVLTFSRERPQSRAATSQ